MDYSTLSKIDKSCYIGETKFCAGIFLSKKIIARKAYGESLRLEKYPEFEQAYEAFLQKYGAKLHVETIMLNKLYQVRDKNCLTVFYNPEMVGITYTEQYSQNIWAICRSDITEFWYKHNMSYEEAIIFAGERFVRYYSDSRLYINYGLGINKVVSLSDVKKSFCAYD